MSTKIVQIQEEVTRELANKETLAALLSTTFKGLAAEQVRLAIVEGMIRGFTFQDFLEKNVYAIPYGNTYSLVTSIDHARKVGMRSNIVGVNEPVYEMDGPKIVACSVTVKRKINETIGDFTAKVYFSEYNTGQNQWAKKPRTMIAKVAEMHALRKACPEALSQLYTADEMGDRGEYKPAEKLAPIDIAPLEKKLRESKTLEELKTVFSALPYEAKQKLNAVKEELKVKLTPPAAPVAPAHA